MGVVETDCQSETGVTVGLIDAILTNARVLITRDLDLPEVKEALRDLQGDPNLQKLLNS